MIQHAQRDTLSRIFTLASVSVLLAGPWVAPQTVDHRLELGAQIAGIRLSGREEVGIGGGMHATWRLRKWLTAEGEFNHIPENPGGNYGQSLIVSGLRVGVPFSSFELADKVRPGGPISEARFFKHSIRRRPGNRRWTSKQCFSIGRGRALPFGSSQIC